MYLIVNLGLKSIRGIIFNETGEQIYSKSFPVHTTLFNEKVEQDVNEWQRLLCLILEDITTNTNLSKSISYISSTTSSSCIYGADNSMNPVTKVLMVSDKRCTQQVAELKSLIHRKGNAPSVLVATSSLVPKALWFKDNDCQIFNQVEYWMGAGEFLNYFFTKEVFTDPLNAGKAFHNGVDYENDLIAEAGLDPQTLPAVKEIGRKFDIDASLIETYQLNPACQYILSTYDAVCAVLGSGTGEEGNACDVSGTVTSVRMLTKNFDIKGSNTFLSQPLHFLGTNLIGASNNLGGGIIEWYKQAIFRSDNEDVYFEMENYARQSRTGSGGIIFVPYLLGERAPIELPKASGTFFGLNRSSSLKDITMAVFESTAYVTKDLLDLIKQSGEKVESLTVSGGLARFDLINQIKSDVTGLPVKVVDNFESTSVGAFIIMAIANKLYTSLSEAQSGIVKVRKIILPSENNHKYYSRSFALYKKLIVNNANLYEEHSELNKLSQRHDKEIMKNL